MCYGSTLALATHCLSPNYVWRNEVLPYFRPYLDCASICRVKTAEIFFRFPVATPNILSSPPHPPASFLTGEYNIPGVIRSKGSAGTDALKLSDTAFPPADAAGAVHYTSSVRPLRQALPPSHLEGDVTSLVTSTSHGALNSLP